MKRDITTLALPPLHRDRGRERARLRPPGRASGVCERVPRCVCVYVVPRRAGPGHLRRRGDAVVVVEGRHERVHRLGGLARVCRRHQACNRGRRVWVDPHLLLLLTLRERGEEGGGPQVLRGHLHGLGREARWRRPLVAVVEREGHARGLRLRCRDVNVRGRLHILLYPRFGQGWHGGVV